MPVAAAPPRRRAAPPPRRRSAAPPHLTAALPRRSPPPRCPRCQSSYTISRFACLLLQAASIAEHEGVGFLMLRQRTTLAELRVILARSLTATSFAEVAKSGSFAFYLHDGRTKVDPEQEMSLELFEHVPGLIIVPGGSGTRRASGMDESAVSASLLLAEAKADQETNERGEFAASLTLGMIVGDGDLATRFKRLTYGELPEENMQFLSELSALREEMDGLANDEMRFALALPKLRFINTTFIVQGTSMKLACDPAVREAASTSFVTSVQVAKGGARDVKALLGCFEAVEKEVSAACERLLPKMRDAVTTVGPLKGVGKARRTVIVVGGGIAGSFTARWFDRYYKDRFDTILVDPKE